MDILVVKISMTRLRLVPTKCVSNAVVLKKLSLQREGLKLDA